jgi:hypothetical protein
MGWSFAPFVPFARDFPHTLRKLLLAKESKVAKGDRAFVPFVPFARDFPHTLRKLLLAKESQVAKERLILRTLRTLREGLSAPAQQIVAHENGQGGLGHLILPPLREKPSASASQVQTS